MKENLFKKYNVHNKNFVYLKIFFSLILVFSFTLLFSNTLVVAQEESNTTSKQDAYDAIERIKEVKDIMENEGFNILRINDTLDTAEEIFLAQKSREESGRQPDYSKVIIYKERAENFYNQAFDVRDELYSLEQGMDELENEGINSSEAQVIVDKIRQEIRDERYDKAMELVPSAEKKISDLEAEHTAAKVFYEATTSSVFGFFTENYKTIFLVLIVLFFSYLALRKRLWKRYYNKKIRNLEDEKKSISDLIKSSQKAYFETGTIPESVYNIRSKKYSELIRDLDRRIPLYQERINKLYDENLLMKPINMIKPDKDSENKKKKKLKINGSKKKKKLGIKKDKESKTKENKKEISKEDKKRKNNLNKLKKKNQKQKKRLEKQAKKDMKKKKKEIKRLRKKRKKDSNKSKKVYSNKKNKNGKRNKKFKKSKK